MSPTEERPANPFTLLVCDSDALIQIFSSDQLSLLKNLKRVYGIQSVVTEAVEDELRNPRQRHAALIEPALERALANEFLIVITRLNIGRFTSNDRHTTYDAIQLKGQDYHRIVQRGEAYTYATALVLRGAVLSNDRRAVWALDRAGKQLPEISLRAYDLFVLFHQRGELSLKDGDDIRKSLTDIGDQPHEAFARCKFVEGLERFYPRLLDNSYTFVGSSFTRELGDEKRAFISELSDHPSPPVGS